MSSSTVVRASRAHGVMELTLQASGWQLMFVSTDGTFTDGARGSCH